VRIRLYSENIDYNSIVELLMPHLVRWFSEKDNLIYDIATGVISRKGKTSNLSRLIVKLIPNKNNLMASIVPHFENVLIEYLNNQLLKYHITARVKELTIKSVERGQRKLLKIELTISEIDYGKTAQSLLPIMLQKLVEAKGQMAQVSKLLNDRKDLCENVVMAAFSAIPEEQRDELLAAFLSAYQVEARVLLNSMLQKNNITAEVSALRIFSE
jgi:hypothetical protein